MDNYNYDIKLTIFKNDKLAITSAENIDNIIYMINCYCKNVLVADNGYHIADRVITLINATYNKLINVIQRLRAEGQDYSKQITELAILLHNHIAILDDEQDI